MLIEELLGKRVTNIFVLLEIGTNGLEKGECIVERNNSSMIKIPYGFSDKVSFAKFVDRSNSIFSDLSDIPSYSLKKVDNAYVPGEVTHHENKVKHLKDRVIVAIIAVEDTEDQKVLFELDNGYIFIETNFSPIGTGLAGLNLYTSLDELIEYRENVYIRKYKST
jgi:hypothetical protein